MKNNKLKFDGIKRKISISIEDDGKGRFNLYLEGDKARIGNIPDEYLGTAEFWGLRLFEMCVNAVAQARAIESVNKMGDA